MNATATPAATAAVAAAIAFNPQIGDKVLYGEKVVTVNENVKKGAKFVQVTDGTKVERIAVEVLKPLPADAKVTSQGKIGTGTVIPKAVRAQYVQHKTKTGSGKSYAIDNNDNTAAELRGMNLEDVYVKAAEVLNANGETTTVAELKARYANLNPGMQRMNLGNRIRGSAHKMQTQKARDAAKAEAKAKKEAADKAKADAKAAKEVEAAKADGEKQAKAAAADNATRSDGSKVKPQGKSNNPAKK